VESTKAAVRRAKANLEQFKAKLSQAQRDWQRAQKLGLSEALAQASYDSYQFAYEVAKANVAVGEASILEANEQDPDAIDRYFVACGSYLRIDGNIVLDSLSKVYSVFTIDREGMDVILRSQPVTNTSLRAFTKPEKIKLNGKQVIVEFNESRKTVKLGSK